MKIIDLLNLVYEKKAPKKILYKYCEYEFEELYDDYKNKDGLYLFEYLFTNEDYPLEKEVEIIEDKPKKIELLNIEEYHTSNPLLAFNENAIELKINKLIENQKEIANKVNYLLEKSDKL